MWQRKASFLNLTMKAYDYIIVTELLQMYCVLAGINIWRNKHGHIEQNSARIWQIGLFSLNNTSTNLFLAMMGYVSYYANGIAGLSVVLISVILTGMRILMA